MNLNQNYSTHHGRHQHHGRPHHQHSSTSANPLSGGAGTGTSPIEQEFAQLAQLIQQVFQAVGQEIAQILGQQGAGQTGDASAATGAGGADPMTAPGGGFDPFTDPTGGAFGFGGVAMDNNGDAFVGFGFGEFGAPKQPEFNVAVKDGQPVVDLGNKYEMHFDKSSSQWTLKNKETGVETKVWGDPHVQQQNGNNWDFKKNMTFELEDGTKITVKTTPYGNGATLSSELDISRGDQGIKVTGLAQTDTQHQLNIEKTNGYLLGWENPTGPVVHESGANWVTDAGSTVNAGYANANL